MNRAIHQPVATPAVAETATAWLRTLVLCDLVDSTALVERLGDQRAAALFRKHDRLTRTLVHQHGGREIDKTDGFLLLFERPIQAVAFALDYQRELKRFNDAEQAPLSARVGIHVGDVMMWDNAADDIAQGAKPLEVEGLVKPIASRLMQLALPRQILLSGVAYALAHRAQGELGPQLDIVRWRTHGRYQFKGVPDPIAVFEVGEEGLAPLKAPPWSGKAHREVPFWRRPSAVAFELLVLLALVALPIYLSMRSEPAIAFANRDWVVVGDLRNLTGEAVFDDSLEQALRVGLEQSRYVNVVPDLRIRDALKRMERDPAKTSVNRTIGSELAEREGAHALILPTIAQIGRHVRVTAEIVDPRTQATVYSDSVEGIGKDSVLPSMDALVRAMRGRLGESMASIGETSAPLADVTTGNLDALKAFSLGLQAMAGAKAREAIALFNQAIKLDPTFAQAYVGLGVIYYSTGKKDEAHKNILKATRNLHRLSARERLGAEGYQALFETPAVMQEKWSLYAKLYPDVMTGQQNLALVDWWYDNDLADAARYFAEITRSRHPRRGYSWMFLGNVQLAMGQTEEARKSYRAAREVGAPQLQFDPINLSLALRNYGQVRTAIEHEPTHGFPYFEAEKALRTAELEADRGRFAAAATSAHAAGEIATHAQLDSALQRARMSGVVALLGAGDSAAPAALKGFIGDELERMAASHGTYEQDSYVQLTLAAMLAMRHGQHALAERVLAALEPQVEHSGYFSLEQPYRVARCEIGIEQDAKKAVACLEGERGERAYYQTHVALMRAYRAAGRNADAATAAAWLADHRGRALGEFLGEFAAHMPNLLASNKAMVELAELDLEAGRRDDASRRLSAFLQAWSDADNGSPLWQRAQALQERLRRKEKQR